jgi:integrase
MQWSSVYKDEWRQTDTKTEADYTVYLSTQAQEILNRQPKTDDYIWSNPRTNCGHVRIDVVINALHKIDFGIDRWTTHDFRRALSTWLGENLVTREINDRMLNHKASGVYETYNRASYNQPAREWWQKWGDHIEELKR